MSITLTMFTWDKSLAIEIPSTNLFSFCLCTERRKEGMMKQRRKSAERGIKNGRKGESRQ